MAIRIDRLRSVTSAFRHDRNGAVALMFGLTVLMLFAAIGIAIDSSRAIRVQTAAKAALDTAALAGAKALRLEGASDEKIADIAKLYFNQNFKRDEGGRVGLSAIGVATERTLNKVTLNVDLDVPTSFGQLFAIERFTIPSTSTAIFDAKDVELGMMLDVSGSMSGGKIDDLKGAAKELAEIILAANKGDVHHKIGVAPYSTAVNAGEFAASAKNNPKPANSCVTERPGANAFKDMGPSGGALGGKATWCPTSSVLPLTEERSTVDAHLNSMVANGTTAGHLGIAWAWYIVSPEWAEVWPAESKPAAYDDPKIMKAVIIMTDGMFNKEYEGGNGNSAEQAKKLCANMKSRGITVFSVGFEAPDDALQILQNCASSGDNFFDAKDGDSLKEAFRAIANRLMALRIAG